MWKLHERMEDGHRFGANEALQTNSKPGSTSDKCSIDIHQEYESLATEMHYRSVSLSTFKSHVQILLSITKPCTDLCEHCQDFADTISRSGNL